MLLAEALGTALLFFGVLAAVAGTVDMQINSLVLAGLFAVAFLLAFYLVSYVSGAHLNPLVSIGMFFAGRMSLKLAALYIVAQVLGALIGAGLAIWLFMPDNLMSCTPAVDVCDTAEQLIKLGLGQFVITFFFVLLFLIVTANPFLASIGGIIIAVGFGLAILASASIGGWIGTNLWAYLDYFTNNNLLAALVMLIALLLGAALAGVLYKVFMRQPGETLLVDCNGKPILDGCCRKQYVRDVTVLDPCGNPVTDGCGNELTYQAVRHDVRQTHLPETYVSYLARAIESETGVHREAALRGALLAKEKAMQGVDLAKHVIAHPEAAKEFVARAKDYYYHSDLPEQVEEVRAKAKAMAKKVLPQNINLNADLGMCFDSESANLNQKGCAGVTYQAQARTPPRAAARPMARNSRPMQPEDY